MEKNNLEQTPELATIQNKPKRKNSVLVVIFAVLALAGIGFGIYGMFFNKNNTNYEMGNADSTQSAAEQQDEDLTIYYSLLDQFILPSTSSNSLSNALNGDVYNEQYMLQSVLFGIGPVYLRGMPINETFLKEEIKEKFNVDYALGGEIVDIVQGCKQLIKENGKYIYNDNCLGGSGTSYNIYDIKSINIDDDALRVDVSLGTIVIEIGRMALIDLKDNTIKEYVSEYNEEKQDWIPAGDQGTEEDLKEYFFQHIDEMETYQLIFKKADKRYYLESSKKLN